MSEAYRGNENLKGANSVDYIDPDEYKNRVREIYKCKQDILYFASTYYLIINLDRGKEIINMYEKQAELVKRFSENRRNIVLASRQSGKTTSYCIYCLWYCLFNPDKNVLIAADKQSTVFDILAKIRIAYEYLPLWLKPGVLSWNKGAIEFSNGSKITGVATTENSGIGKSCNCLHKDTEITIEKNGTLYTMPIEQAYHSLPQF